MWKVLAATKRFKLSSLLSAVAIAVLAVPLALLTAAHTRAEVAPKIEVVPQMLHTDRVNAIVFSPDGSYLGNL